MPLVYRSAQLDDLVATDELVVGSINELTVRHGFGPIAAASPPDFQRFSLKDDPDGLWIAEDDGDILGFAWSWVCGELWFLAQLFVDPAAQGRGIGDALLVRALEHARKSRTTHRALITFGFNRVSQGLYMRHGLYPRAPIYSFSVERERLKSALRQPPLRAVPLDGSASTANTLADIDRLAVGASRAKHHRYLLDASAVTAVLLYEGDDCVGYAYIAPNGHIGPLAVTRAEILHDAFATALGIAADGASGNVSALVPGTCDRTLGLAIEHGMRIALPMLLMASPGYGDWTRYMPRNPGFM
jgi:GNAT superfamily N-acetyltransferase